MSETEQLLETYKKRLAIRIEEINALKDTIEQLENTVKRLQGEPKPLADMIYDVELVGKHAALLVNRISKNGKAIIKLYGNQIVEIL